MMIMMLCGFAAYAAHIGADDMVVKLASKPLQYINSPYLLMICRLFCRLSNVSGRLFRNRSGCFLLMANLFPGDGKRWYQSLRSCLFVPPPGGDYSRTDFRGCGAGGASFRNVAD